MSFLSSDCSCSGVFIGSVVQCKGCACEGVSCTHYAPQWVEATQRVIQNQVRTASSQYMGSLAAMNVRGPFGGPRSNNPIATYNFVNWMQGSDRNVPSQTARNVPSRGNSTKTSLTRCRPGAACAGGTNANGVDIKHNSYQRYLLRKKAGNIREKAKIVANTDAAQAYFTQYSLVQNSGCAC